VAPEQLVDTLTQTFTIAASSNKTLGVAIGIADAVGKIQASGAGLGWGGVRRRALGSADAVDRMQARGGGGWLRPALRR
jgi:hypothetical protein